MNLTAYLSLNVEIITPQGDYCQVKPLLNLTPYLARYYATRRLLTGPASADPFNWLLILALSLCVVGLALSAPLVALGAVAAVALIPAFVGAAGGLCVATAAISRVGQ